MSDVIDTHVEALRLLHMKMTGKETNETTSARILRDIAENYEPKSLIVTDDGEGNVALTLE